MQPFPKEAADILLASVESKDVEIKPGVCERFRKVVSVADLRACRRPHLPPRNQVPACAQQGFRPRWLGPGPEERDQCRAESRE